MKKILYIIIPCYNEFNTLQSTSSIFINKLNTLIKGKVISEKSRLLFVDDGSTDDTFVYLKKIAKKQKTVKAISLSRNAGHQIALLAGLDYAKQSCDMSITIDADLQDDIDKIDEMIDCYYKGNDIVYGVRKNRLSDSFFKRTTAEAFYRFQKLLGVEIVFNHADFRLLSRRAMESLLEYKEQNVYIRGIVTKLGYKSCKVYYDRKCREVGNTKYSLPKMISLALNGITSFSISPLRLIMFIGFLVAIVSFVGVVWSIIRSLTGNTVVGWASMTSIICFVSGIQLLCIGIIGEYIGKIYIETKNRPRYFISEKV